MKYTKDEAHYFYWHCMTAALLMEQLKKNTATCSHIQRAVRMATETAVGKNGVQYASRVACQQKPPASNSWAGLGFVREHVVPVSVIAKEVMAAHESGDKRSWRSLVDSLAQDDLQHWNVIDSDYFLDQVAPLSAVVATIVRQSAILAWITKEEDKALKKAGLTKVMPPGDGRDALARYKLCGIDLVQLLPVPGT